MKAEALFQPVNQEEKKALSYPFTAFLDLWCIHQQLQHVLMPADHPPTTP